MWALPSTHSPHLGPLALPSPNCVFESLPHFPHRSTQIKWGTASRVEWETTSGTECEPIQRCTSNGPSPNVSPAADQAVPPAAAPRSVLALLGCVQPCWGHGCQGTQATNIVPFFPNAEVLGVRKVVCRQADEQLLITKLQVWAIFGLQRDLQELRWIFSLWLAQPMLLQLAPEAPPHHPTPKPPMARDHCSNACSLPQPASTHPPSSRCYSMLLPWAAVTCIATLFDVFIKELHFPCQSSFMAWPLCWGGCRIRGSIPSRVVASTVGISGTP